jgi:hypothetical protein
MDRRHKLGEARAEIGRVASIAHGVHTMDQIITDNTAYVWQAMHIVTFEGYSLPFSQSSSCDIVNGLKIPSLLDLITSALLITNTNLYFTHLVNFIEYGLKSSLPVRVTLG